MMFELKGVKLKEIVLFICVVLIGLVLSLFFIRLFSERQIDDVSLEISCNKDILDKADVLFVIPKFEGEEIDSEWCSWILSLDKELGLHGVYHTYNEFSEDRSEEYLLEGINIFEKCFGYKPERFKPPQLKITESNKEMIDGLMYLDLGLNQLFHKVYHCDDSGFFSNWVG